VRGLAEGKRGALGTETRNKLKVPNAAFPLSPLPSAASSSSLDIPTCPSPQERPRQHREGAGVDSGVQGPFLPLVCYLTLGWEEV
jgi:hypothetical protein